MQSNFLSPNFLPRFDIKSPELFFKQQPPCLPVCARAGAYHKAVRGDEQVLAVQSYFWPTSRREMERKGSKSWRRIQSQWGCWGWGIQRRGNGCRAQNLPLQQLQALPPASRESGDTHQWKSTNPHALLIIPPRLFSDQSAQFLDPPTPGDGAEYI